MPRSFWHKWNNILHRDIGYLVWAMTIIYSISGIAINHVADWNPNYSIKKEFFSIDPVEAEGKDAIVEEALRKLNLTETPKNAFRPDPETLQLFFEGKTFSVDLPTGKVMRESVAERRVLYEMNQLHYNRPKKVWTYIADLYALALLVVAITGLFVLKGRNGITGRGAWLTTIGALIPLLYWLYYIYA